MSMTFDELVTKVRGMASKVDASQMGFLAVQINPPPHHPRVFYVESKDGKINVEPYEYNDRQCSITMSMDNFNKLIDGKMNPVTGFTLGKIKVDGDVGKALEFANAVKK